MAYLIQGGARQFKEHTKKTITGKGILKIRVSGSNLIPIIAALEHYEKSIHKPLIEVQGALCSVISKCKKWKVTKHVKLASTNDALATVKVREGFINTLMAEAWDALRNSDHGEMSGAFQAYSARKSAGAYNTGSLANDYTTERKAYLASGKTKSLSGSLIDDLLAGGKHRATPLFDGEKFVRINGVYVKNAANKNIESPAFKNWKAQNQARKERIAKATKGRSLGALTVVDYRKIDKIAATLPGGSETKYMKRPERLRCMLESDGAGGLRYAVGQRSAATPGNAAWPYAMDEWGNIYTADDQLDASKDGKAMFNHSSFTAGDDVVCAGVLQIGANGKLIFIDTNSGHYKPTDDQLRAVVSILRDEYAVDTATIEASLFWPNRLIWPAGQIDRFMQGLPPQ